MSWFVMWHFMFCIISKALAYIARARVLGLDYGIRDPSIHGHYHVDY